MSPHVNPILRDLPRDEMESVRGGAPLTVLSMLRPGTVTWKYVDGTPAWAIQNAIDIGYEVENLSD
jgi:hypothetical protein